MTKAPSRSSTKSRSSKTSKTAAKPIVEEAAVAAPEAVAETVAPDPVIADAVMADAPLEPADESSVASALRKKELIERVVLVSGAKKKVAKDIVEATLQVLGEALQAGEALDLPPFGKTRLTKTKDIGAGGSMMTLKLRRGAAKKSAADEDSAKEALAEPAE